MLSDIERKILRIIYNYSIRWKELPGIEELQVKTGRSREGVFKVLSVLNKEGYIEWSEALPEQIVLIEGWERKPGYSFKASAFDAKHSPFMN